MRATDPARGAFGPLVLCAIFAAARALSSTEVSAPSITPVAVDAGRDDAEVLEALAGMGSEAAHRIVAARAHGVAIDTPGDLLAIPGIGARRLHRWHDDLVFPRERP